MRLTSNQKETLHEIVVGYPGGRLLKPIPSLIKHGLVTTVVTQGVYHEPTRSWVRNPETLYRLTPLGLEVYTKLRLASHEAQVKEVDVALGRDLLYAKARTVN